MMPKMRLINPSALFLILVAIPNSFSYLDYNLPTNILPILYDLNLQITPGSETFTGNLTLTFNVTEETNTVQLHTSPDHLKVTNILKLDGNETSDCKINHTSTDSEIIKILCTKQFSAKKHRMNIEYTGTISKDGKGIFEGTYVENGVSEILVATDFKPIYARRLFPCFDEPKFKAQFDITVIHPSDYTALGNTPVKSEEKGPGENELTTTFQRTPMMSSYSLALVISKLQGIDVSTESLNFTIYTRPSVVDSTGIAKQYGKALIDAMGKWTNILYSSMGLKKMEFVALPGLATEGSPNWGLIAFQESNLLDEGEATTAEHKQTIIRTMSRLVAHQWFGGLISQEWWSNSWLYEGFATYFEFFLPEMVEDLDLQLVEQFSTKVFHLALEEDSYISYPLSKTVKEVQTKSQIEGMLRKLSRIKGASVLKMYIWVLNGRFQSQVQAFLNENQYNVTPSEKYCNAEVGGCEFLESYLHNSGYPLITISIAEDTEVGVNEEIFNIINYNRTANVSWSLPILYTTGDANEDDDDDEPTLSDIRTYTTGEGMFYIVIQNGSWITFNNGQEGFFRVNYDTTLWLRLVDALHATNMSNIDEFDRAALVDDIINIARIGQVEYEIVFKLIEYLKQEIGYSPWVAYARGVDYMMDQLVDEETVGLLQDVSSYYLKTAFPDMNNDIDEVHLNVLKDTAINEWKCAWNDQDCLNYVEGTFSDFKKSMSFLNNNQRYMILCNALKTSDDVESDYNFMLELFKNSNSAYMRKDLLRALGCSPTDETQNRILSELMESTITNTEASDVINAVLENRNNGVANVLQFLEENLSTLAKKYDGYISVSSMFIAIAKKVNDEAKMEKLSQLIESATEILGDTQELLENSRAIANTNILWAKTHGDNIKAILQAIKIPKHRNNALSVYNGNIMYLALSVITSLNLMLI